MRSEKIMTIEYLRGLAALAVAWFHLTNSYGQSWMTGVGGKGWLGVDMFFVISGFIIPYSISRLFVGYSLRNFPYFVMRRMMRIEAPYVVSIVLVIGLGYLSALAPGFQGSYPRYEQYQLAAHLFYFIPLTSYPWLQPVYWTLAYEFVFYLFIGIMFNPICGSGKQIAWLSAALLVCLGVALAYLPDRTLLFVVGIAAYRRIGHQDRGGAAIVGLCAAIMVLRGEAAIATIGLATGAAIVWGGRVGIPRAFGLGLQGLGAISYSLYLTHVPVGGRVVNLGRRFVEGPWQELSLSIVALAISVAFAAMFWIAVERPAVDFARRLSEGSRTVSVGC